MASYEAEFAPLAYWEEEGVYLLTRDAYPEAADAYEALLSHFAFRRSYRVSRKSIFAGALRFDVARRQWVLCGSDRPPAGRGAKKVWIYVE